MIHFRSSLVAVFVLFLLSTFAVITLLLPRGPDVHRVRALPTNIETDEVPSYPSTNGSAPLRELAPSVVTARESTTSFVVRVRSAAGAPVADARVLLFDRVAFQESRFPHEARTTDDGRCSLPRPDSRSVAYLLASADGFASTTLDLPRLVPHGVEVVLQSPFSLKGRVSLENGASPPQPLHVFAWSSADDPSAAAFSQAISSPEDSYIRFTVTDSEGYFELQGLEPLGTYSIGAGGGGWASHTILRNVSIDTPSLNIRVWRVHGAIVKPVFENAEDGPPSTLAVTTWDIQSDGATSLVVPSIHLALAGISSSTADATSQEWRKRVFAFLSPDIRPTLGPIDVHYIVPGIEPVIVSLNLPPVDKELPVHSFVIRQSAVAFGSVHLQFSGVSLEATDNEMLTSGIFLAPHYLELRSDANPELAFRIDLSRITQPREIAGVPCGWYHARFVAANGGWTYPKGGAIPIVVRPDPTTVQLPLADLGLVLLEAEQHDSRQLSLAARIVTRRKGGHPKSAQYAFHHPPYLLTGLPAGTYDIQIWLTDKVGAEVETAQLGDVIVQSGQLVERAFAWNR